MPTKSSLIKHALDEPLTARATLVQVWQVLCSIVLVSCCTNTHSFSFFLLAFVLAFCPLVPLFLRSTAYRVLVRPCQLRARNGIPRQTVLRAKEVEDRFGVSASLQEIESAHVQPRIVTMHLVLCSATACTPASWSPPSTRAGHSSWSLFSQTTVALFCPAFFSRFSSFPLSLCHLGPFEISH